MERTKSPTSHLTDGGALSNFHRVQERINRLEDILRDVSETALSTGGRPDSLQRASSHSSSVRTIRDPRGANDDKTKEESRPLRPANIVEEVSNCETGTVDENKMRSHFAERSAKTGCEENGPHDGDTSCSGESRDSSTGQKNAVGNTGLKAEPPSLCVPTKQANIPSNCGDWASADQVHELIDRIARLEGDVHDEMSKVAEVVSLFRSHIAVQSLGVGKEGDLENDLSKPTDDPDDLLASEPSEAPAFIFPDEKLPRSCADDMPSNNSNYEGTRLSTRKVSKVTFSEDEDYFPPEDEVPTPTRRVIALKDAFQATAASLLAGRRRWSGSFAMSKTRSAASQKPDSSRKFLEMSPLQESCAVSVSTTGSNSVLASDAEDESPMNDMNSWHLAQLEGEVPSKGYSGRKSARNANLSRDQTHSHDSPHWSCASRAPTPGEQGPHRTPDSSPK